jgi:anti-anti-sigma factor
MSQPSAASFERRDVSGNRTLFVGGEIDLDNAHELRDQLRCAMRESHSPTVVDLSGVEFMDSSGINALIDAHRNAPEFGSNLVIVAPSTACRRVFEMLRLGDVIDIRDTD